MKKLITRRRRPVGSAAPDPFRVLGLTPDPELSDDDVRAAWRRVAAASHPDRADGGDPETFAAAAAAYTVLRTTAARRDSLTEMTTGRHARLRPAFPRWRPPALVGSAHARMWRGRPGRLALRVVAAGGVAAVAVAAVGWQPASIGVTIGALTWLSLTGRADLAPPQPRARSWPRQPR